MLAMSMAMASSARRFVETSVGRAGLCAGIAIVGAHLRPPAHAQSVVAWGQNAFGECNIPPIPAGRTPIAVSAGNSISMVLLDNNTILTAGVNFDGQGNPPNIPAPRRVRQIDAGKGSHALAVLDDGTVVGWGNNAVGQCTIPMPPAGTWYTEIAAGGSHSLALRSDGHVSAWGDNSHGQCNVPVLTIEQRYTAVAAGAYFSLLARSDGALIAFGQNNHGQCNVASAPRATVAQLAANVYRSMVMGADGMVDSWGLCSTCECCLPTSPLTAPTAAISAGGYFTLLLRADGSVLSVGNNCCGQASPPPSPDGMPYVSISAGYNHALALTGPSCELIATYCTAGTTVHGCVPSIAGIGAPSSQATSGFDIVVNNVPGQRYGLLYYGFYPVAVPWSPASTSYRCVSFPQQRMPVVDTGGTAGQCNGELRIDFNAWLQANPGGLGNPFVQGQVFHAQGWFRDPGAPKQTNLSDGLRFTLCD